MFSLFTLSVSPLPWPPTPIHAILSLSLGADSPEPARTRRGTIVKAAIAAAEPSTSRLDIFILFVFFFGADFYISTYLFGKANILKLYTKFVLSAYLSVLCISGLIFFKKKVVKTLGPVLLIGMGQLFIVVFDIICIVV